MVIMQETSHQQQIQFINMMHSQSEVYTTMEKWMSHNGTDQQNKSQKPDRKKKKKACHKWVQTEQFHLHKVQNKTKSNDISPRDTDIGGF